MYFCSQTTYFVDNVVDGDFCLWRFSQPWMREQDHWSPQFDHVIVNISAIILQDQVEVPQVVQVCLLPLHQLLHQLDWSELSNFFKFQSRRNYQLFNRHSSSLCSTSSPESGGETHPYSGRVDPSSCDCIQGIYKGVWLSQVWGFSILKFNDREVYAQEHNHRDLI